MSDTKWDELRLAMHKLKGLSPRWRTLDLVNGYLSPWDREWFYHFRNGGYKTIQWVEIAPDSEEQRKAILQELIRIHVPGEHTESCFRVLGYAAPGQTVHYIEE